MMCDHELRPALVPFATSVVLSDVEIPIRPHIPQHTLMVDISSVRGIVTALWLHPLGVFVGPVALDEAGEDGSEERETHSH